MSSPITFSGFNNIDFNTVVNLLMQQESQPLYALQAQQSALNAQSTAFSTLATRLASLQSAAEDLSNSSSLAGFTASSTDATIASVSAGSSAVAGQYDVVVQELAHSQVTASSTTTPDADTTAVATGGSVVIGGISVAVTQSVTLKGLAGAINGTTGIGVTASVVATGTNAFRLVLTSKSTGIANAFTVTNALTGGAGVGFTDTDNDNISGDTAADNAVQATDASLLVNNIAITSATNTLDSAIPGVTLTLAKKAPTTTVTVSVAASQSEAEEKIADFVTAYNSVLSFITTQNSAAAKGATDNLGHNSLLRGLKSTLARTLTARYVTGGALAALSEAGIGFDRSGHLTFNKATFEAASASGAADVSKLFAGSGATSGAFDSLTQLIKEYAQSGGLVATAKTTLTTQISRMTDQLGIMEARLARRRITLQQEFTAADKLMSQLSSQSGSLSAFSSTLKSSFS